MSTAHRTDMAVHLVADARRLSGRNLGHNALLGLEVEMDPLDRHLPVSGRSDGEKRLANAIFAIGPKHRTTPHLLVVVSLLQHR